MRIFGFLYQKMMAWSRHRHAPYYLYGLSFAESSFFPIPPDVMLAPMSLARPDKAWSLAVWTTLASVLGGLFGYMIGCFFFKLVDPYIIKLGYQQTFAQIEIWFKTWGFWILFFAGFGPIPYKLFTIAAGTVNLALLPFVLGSTIGRGGRFFLVTAAMRWGGPKVEQLLIKYIERIGWACVIILIISVFIWHWYKA